VLTSATPLESTRSAHSGGLGSNPGPISIPANVLKASLQSLPKQVLTQIAEATAEEAFALLAAAIGCIVCAPFVAIGVGIYELLSAIGVVGPGKPKLGDTVEAAQRLAGTQSVALRILSLQLAYLAQNQVPLSSDAPGVQSMLSGLVHNAVLGLEQEYGWTRQHAAAVVATYLSGTPQPYCGAHCWYVPKAQSGGSSSQPPPPPPSGSQGSQPGPPSAPPSGPGSRFSPWGIVQAGLGPIGLLRNAGFPLSFQTAGATIGGAYGGVQGAEFGSTVGEMVDQSSQFVNGYWNSIKSQFGGGNPSPQPVLNPQPSYPGLPPSGNQPEYYELKPCPECGYNPSPQQGQVLSSQEEQLNREISNEQNQLLVQKIVEQQEQIDRLRGLEQQPASSRNIPQELAQKQSLLSQIAQEQRGIVPQGGMPPTAPQGGTYPAPDTGYQSQPIEVQPQNPPGQNQQPLFIQKQAEHGQLPSPVGGVQFCIQCSSQEESIKFLNGEPSECSVISGSTRST
jgi:hypothetical protein